MDITLLKRLDYVLGNVFVAIVPVQKPLFLIPSVKSLLIIRPGGIGDAVLLAPTINCLRKQYPTCKITVLSERRNAGVFTLIPSIDHLYCYDKPTEFLGVLRKKFDVVIDTEQWHRLSAVVARLVRSSVKIGFATNDRRRMFTHTLPYSHDEYEVINFVKLIEPLNVSVDPADATVPFLTIPSTATLSTEKLLAPLDNKPFITIFPGASIPERRWGAVQFQEVAEYLQHEGYKIVVVGGSVDKLDGQTTAGVSGLNLAGQTSLAETAAIIARSSLLLSGDSGVLHLAVGLGISTVSLFGPGRELKWAPCGNQHTVINKRLSCSPCTIFGTTPPCPYNARCMQEITVEDVVASCLNLLKKPVR